MACSKCLSMSYQLEEKDETIKKLIEQNERLTKEQQLTKETIENLIKENMTLKMLLPDRANEYKIRMERSEESQCIVAPTEEVVNNKGKMLNADENSKLVTSRGINVFRNSGGAADYNSTMMKSEGVRNKTIQEEVSQVTRREEDKVNSSVSGEITADQADQHRQRSLDRIPVENLPGTRQYLPQLNESAKGPPKQNFQPSSALTDTDYKDDSGKSNQEYVQRTSLQNPEELNEYAGIQVKLKVGKNNHISHWMGTLYHHGLACPVPVRDLQGLGDIDMVVLIDLDNLAGFVEDYFRSMHDKNREGRWLKILYICVQNKDTNFKPLQSAEVISLEKDKMINLVPTSNDKQEADHVLFLMAGQLDNDIRIRDSLPLVVLAGDDGYQTLLRCQNQNLLRHRVHIENLHHDNIEEVVQKLLTYSKEEDERAVDMAEVRKQESTFGGNHGPRYAGVRPWNVDE